jgi:CMP-N-acetylneuraminic acid synthetase
LEDHGERFDAVATLQATNPLRRSCDIDNCADLLIRSRADSVMTVIPVPDSYNPHWVYFQSEDGGLRLSTGEAFPIPRRQDLPPAFHRDGSVYITRREVLMNDGSIYGRVVGYALDPSRSVNIDTLDDWNRAEDLLKGGR